MSLQGLWTGDGALYLADLRHPTVAAHYRERKQELGLRYDEEMPPRERRQFDRDMIRTYGFSCPPPARAEWALQVYDIMDAEEERAARNRRARVPVTVRVCEPDEDLW